MSRPISGDFAFAEGLVRVGFRDGVCGGGAAPVHLTNIMAESDPS